MTRAVSLHPLLRATSGFLCSGARYYCLHQFTVISHHVSQSYSYNWIQCDVLYIHKLYAHSLKCILHHMTITYGG